MKRLVVMTVAAGAAVAASAMPTKADLQKAQEMVSDVTSADVAALKAKTKTPAEVAAKHMELAGQSSSEAEKYLLLQAAFKLYAKAGDYDAAANVIEKLQAEITDYNPEVTVELCGAEFIRKMRENAPRLYALKENARRIVFYRKQLPIREAAVKKNPKDAQAQRKLAECHAELGDWPKALEVFVKAGGEFKKMAEGETSGKVPAQELGDFWWDYETKSDTPIYKLHAAELYRKALADDTFKGLARTRTEQRVKEVEKVAVDLPHQSVSAPVVLDATSLAHRWSFSKDFIDTVGKIEAKVIGKDVGVKDNQCVCDNGGLCLEGVLPAGGNDFTAEFWCKVTKIGSGARLIKMGEAPRIAISSDGKKVQFFRNRWGNRDNGGQEERDFAIDIGHRYYIAITCCGHEANVYVYDMDGDKRLRQYSHIFESDIKITEDILLGTNWAHPRIFPERNLAYGGAMFDEIRIWRVCKSKEDVEAAIKAGPDRVVMPNAKPVPTTTFGQNTEDSWSWVIPTKTYAGWKVSKTQPDSTWIFADSKTSDDWAGGIGYTMIPHGDSSNRRWMRAEVEWRGDLQKIEAAELVYRINDHATVWINGIEIASRISAGGEYASKDITAKFKATFKNAVKTPVCVEVVNTHGGGGGDVGIRVKMRK